MLRRLDAIEKAIEDPERSKIGQEGLMRRWGALLVSASQDAFVKQTFGGHDWPARYEGMEPPFINIAGALADFEGGRSSPKPSRFQDRPALVDEGLRGGLWGSITYAVPDPRSVQVGTNKPYAQVHNEGGTTQLFIGTEGKKRVQDWLFKKKAPFEPRKGREGYVGKLWPAAVRGVLFQKIAKRPFLGVTEDTAKDLVRATEDYFREELGGGAATLTA
jgi:phage gpG-like protein